MLPRFLHRLLERLSLVSRPDEDAQALLERMTRVFHLSTEITALENPTAIPSRVVEALVEELGLPVASIVLEDAESGKLVYAADKGVPAEVKAMGFREGGIALTAFRSGEARFVEDMGADPSANPGARPFFQAYACLPIRSHERTFGLVFVNYGEPHRFTPVERDILRTFANQTAIALDNARLREAERQRSAALASLANLGRDLARSLDPEDLLRVIERTLRDQFPHLRAGAFWALEDGRLVPRHRFGLGDGPTPENSLAPETSRLMTLAASGSPEAMLPLALLEDLGLPETTLPQEPGQIHGKALSLSTSEGLEGLIGLIFTLPSQRSGEADLDFLRTLGDRAALALHNARLYASSRRAAERDGLTQVLNRTTFVARLQASLEQALRQDLPLALLMLDADHFKRCNDDHGHAFGDRVLVALSAEIRQSLRPTDTVGRLGGEEFAVFLPGANAETAARVAERIRLAMSRLSLELSDGTRVAAPTVSQGIALAPEHGTDPASLLERADEALYRAKAGGRNRTCVAGA